jgi:hypothetical protein
MTEDLILMERLEPRENKDIVKMGACSSLGVLVCVTLGVDLIEAISDFIANPPPVDPKNVKELCGSCSIQ